MLRTAAVRSARSLRSSEASRVAHRQHLSILAVRFALATAEENVPLSTGVYQTDALPRRPFLGLEIGRPPLDVVGPTEPSQYVAGVTENASAARAGVVTGDFLIRVNDEAPRDLGELIALSRRLETGAPVRFVVSRSGQDLVLVDRLDPLPAEHFDEGNVVLGHIIVDGHRLRTIYTIPHGPGPWPAVFYLQGLPCTSCEYPFEPDHPVRRLISGWTSAGFATMRLERSGVGDSEGPPCSQGDFEWELRTCRAALRDVEKRDVIARRNIFLFGYSLGGMVAPLLARAEGLAGIAVFGASAGHWFDCVASSTRRQLQLSGWTGNDLEERVRDLTERAAPAAGRHMSFFQQLDASDLARAWRELDVPSLVLHGEYDWVCSSGEAQAISDLANEGHAGSSQCVELARMGHDLLAHGDLEQSFRQRSRGLWDPIVLEESTRWFRERMT
jgi:pimeloyl-ACP methyl ester carboxylesterase